MTDDPLHAFAKGLAIEIEDAVSGPDAPTPFSSEMFTRTVLERLEEAGHLEAAFDLHQEGYSGRASYRIDGYSFDEERGVLDLFTTLHIGDVPPVKLLAVDVSRAFERALRFARAAVDGLANKLEPSNTDASDLARRIEQDADKITAIRLTLLTDALLPSSLPRDADWGGRLVEHDAYDIVRLHRVLGEGETRSDITVDLKQLTGDTLPCLHIRPSNGGYEAYLAVLPGDVLSRVYHRYGVRLLELNVRAFLGIQGRKSVNAELRRTIVEQPSMFMAFNNGIVATVDDIVLEKDLMGREHISRLLGLQIVNGGQTTASLHRARWKESIKLDGVEVPVKIIHVTDGNLSTMVSSVSRAANRQNTVQLADFSASDPFHQEVETLANNMWLDDGRGRWFYERARGSYLAAEQKASYRKTDQQNFRMQTPKTRRLSKLDLARYLHAWSGLPFRVCLGGQKNFQYFMQRMKDHPPPPPDDDWFRKLIAITILYRSAERVVRLMKFPAYRAQIVAYIVSGFSHRAGGRMDFEGIWKGQAISPAMEELIRQWAPQIDVLLRMTAGQRNPGEWFKKEDCWTEIRDKLPLLTDPLPPELANAGTATAQVGAPTASELSADDFERVRLCMEIPSLDWLEAAEKGQQAKAIHWRTAGICRTLASYAAGGWQRKPSAKQARFALAAVNTVRQAGLLDRDGVNA